MILIDFTRNRFPDAAPAAKHAASWVRDNSQDGTVIVAVVRADQSGAVSTSMPGTDVWVVEQLHSYDDTDRNRLLAAEYIAGRLSELPLPRSEIRLLTYDEQLFPFLHNNAPNLQIRHQALAPALKSYFQDGSAGSLPKPGTLSPSPRIGRGVDALRSLVERNMLDDWLLASSLRLFLARVDPVFETKGGDGEVGLILDEARKAGVVEIQGAGGTLQVRGSERFRSATRAAGSPRDSGREDLDLRQVIYHHLSSNNLGPFTAVRLDLYEQVDGCVRNANSSDIDVPTDISVLELISVAVAKARKKYEESPAYQSGTRSKIGWTSAKQFLLTLFSRSTCLIDDSGSGFSPSTQIGHPDSLKAVHSLRHGWKEELDLIIAREAWQKVCEMSPNPGFKEYQAFAAIMYPDTPERDTSMKRLFTRLVKDTLNQPE